MSDDSNKTPPQRDANRDFDANRNPKTNFDTAKERDDYNAEFWRRKNEGTGS